jgi:hypothetical protein
MLDGEASFAQLLARRDRAILARRRCCKPIEQGRQGLQGDVERIMKDREGADPDYVQSFVWGLDVIRAFSRFRPRMTLSEVA